MTACEDWYMDGGKSMKDKPGMRMFGGTCWVVAEGGGRGYCDPALM